MFDHCLEIEFDVAPVQVEKLSTEIFQHCSHTLVSDFMMRPNETMI